MALTATQNTSALGNGVAQGFFARIGGLATAFAEWRRARQTAMVLGALSARQLEDIGLTRADVEDMKAQTLL
ncbi:MAG: DUF1127 domain-containing protein [Pseudomonadota bacterium]